MTTPAKPDQFHPELAPPGVEVKFYSRWRERPFLSAPPRLILAHTNAASYESNVEAASAWAERNTWGDGQSYTIPHYQLDRDGRCRKILPSNRRGIANATAASAQGKYGNVSGWSLAVETADSGTRADPAISPFTPQQVEGLARIFAYESLVPGSEIVLDLPEAWHEAGAASHTDPFPYPYWTVQKGKFCPGDAKKLQLRNQVLSRARDIAAGWSQPEVPMLPAPRALPINVYERSLVAWAPVPGAVHYHVRWKAVTAPGFRDEDQLATAETSILLDHNGTDLWVEVRANPGGGQPDGEVLNVWATRPA